MEKHDTIVNSLMSYLYMVLTDGKREVSSKIDQDRFITWCLPGIPIDFEDLRFAREGLIGKGADDAEKGRDTALLAQQAFNFFRLVDFIPDVTGNHIVSFQPGNKSLSSVYEAALRHSKIADTPPTKEEQEIIDNATKELYVEEEVTDPDTKEKTMMLNDSPMVKGYKKHLKLVEDAFIEFNGKRIMAQVAATPKDVLDFNSNGKVFRNKLLAALRDWEVAGKKNKVEALQAAVAQITDRSLVGWKQKLVDRLTVAKRTHPDGDYYPTSVVPASFLRPEISWPKFTFDQSKVEKFSKFKNTEYGGGASFLGAFTIGGKGKKSTDSKSATENVTGLTVSFEVAQVPLSMPWLDIAFLESRAWKFAEDAIDVKALSDGGAPPKGMLIGYPTMVIFVKKLVIDFKELHDEKSEYNKAIKGGGGLSFGVFSAGGSYKTTSGETKSLGTIKKEGLVADSPQIIGFRCKLLKKAPNPHPKIKNFI